MKKRFLPMLLLMLMGVAGNLMTMAQTPEPSGQWKFDDPSDLMAATVGNLKMSPLVIGSSSVSPATVDEASIEVADGPKGGRAILVPAASALKVERAEGAKASTSYTFMLDMMVLNAYAYDGLFQTNSSNSNDGDLFISKHQIGMNALGGYFGSLRSEFWNRIVLTNSDGAVKVYVNGEKVINRATTDGRWEIDPWGFYLLCDEDGEKVDTYVSEVAFWETPLTDEQVAEMGGIGDFPWITDVSQIEGVDNITSSATASNLLAVLPANPRRWPACRIISKSTGATTMSIGETWTRRPTALSGQQRRLATSGHSSTRKRVNTWAI